MRTALTKATISVLLGGFLAGCAQTGYAPQGSDSYQVGYAVGCQNGYQDGGYQTNVPRDEDAFENDPDYRRGWLEGHAKCYEQQQLTPRHNYGGARG